MPRRRRKRKAVLCCSAGGREIDAVERDSAQGSTRDLTHFRLGPLRGDGDDFPKSPFFRKGPQ